MTQTAALLIPMIILIFFTFGIMLWMLKLRYRAVLKDGLDVKYFRLYGNDVEVPEYLVKVTQHYQNMLEMPPLFYLALILIVSLNITDTFYVILSWGFLLTRLVHSYIHTNKNRLFHRRNAFFVSMLILMIVWLKIAIAVISL